MKAGTLPDIDRIGCDDVSADGGVWRNTIAAADEALEEASRIQRGVEQALRLQREVRSLREDLRKAHAEIDRFRGMHARVVVGMRQMEEEHASEVTRLKTDSEMLLVRHRVYKLLSEYYALRGLRLDAAVYAGHRERVLQHIVFQMRKGVELSQLGVNDISFLLG